MYHYIIIMIDYKIAIRSYKRANTIDKTLKILDLDGIEKSKIYIFCPLDEIEEYKKINGDDYNYIDGGNKGTNYCNNLIIDFFDLNDYIIQMDDDINGVYKLLDYKQTIKTGDKANGYPIGLTKLSILDLIIEGKKEMDNNFLNLWGMYPVNNYYFMNSTISHDLKFCIGRIFGFNNTKDVICGDDCRDDYERSILYYIRDGGVIRFNKYVCDADTYIGSGGLAEIRTKEKMENSVLYMIDKYPEYVKRKKTKGKYPEIRLIQPK